MLFPLFGLASLVWFLVRVIPKPSRAAYPCMKAAAPIASSFVVYLLGLFASVVFYKKARKYFHEARYALFSIALLSALILGIFTYLQNDEKAYAAYHSVLEGPNQPMGEGKGINPGRVVWIHNPDATDENCTNKRNDYWWQDDNTNQDVVNQMLSEALRAVSSTESDAAAWDAIFHFFNKAHGKGDVGYTAGEKIVIKINLNGMGNYPQDPNINTAPQLCHAVLNQLVNVAGVAQTDIGIGDPSHDMNTVTSNKCLPDFPNVKYWGSKSGQTATPASTMNVLFSSDGTVSDPLPQCYLDAAYMINIPVFKKHHRAGISLACKNHFGSTSPYTGGAWQWHYSLPCPEADNDVSNGEYGAYRCFVDIMGHKDLGGKTILYLVDGIWSSVNWGHPPIKWSMTPFNGDWPNSLFISQDPVAIESVGFDFLYYEFDEDHPTEGGTPTSDKGPFPHYAGVDDYLHQAADSLNWPQSIVYDPENDGTPLPQSLGTHEHWNNSTEKKYSRNLGLDTGIELYSKYTTAVEKENPIAQVKYFSLNQNYPNPFNASTSIEFTIPVRSQVTLAIYNIQGQKIRTILEGYQEAGLHVQRWDGYMDNGIQAPSGVYHYKLMAHGNDNPFELTKRMVLSK